MTVRECGSLEGRKMICRWQLAAGDLINSLLMAEASRPKVV